MAQQLKLTVNGKERTVVTGGSILLPAVLAGLELQLDRVAVEHNGRIVRRTAWDHTAVEDGDKLEIVHFVGGGAG